MDLETRTEEFTSEDRRWMATRHGVDDTEGVTLDGDLFPTGDYPEGRVPSGLILARVSATGLYGPYDPAQDPAMGDGRHVPTGHLFTSLRVAAGRRASGAQLRRGSVIAINVPAQTPVTTAVRDGLHRIDYR